MYTEMVKNNIYRVSQIKNAVMYRHYLYMETSSRNEIAHTVYSTNGENQVSY